MASNIDYISVDATYPIAGKDNDSQGFRDNFSVIKNNFQSAKGEIEDLQLNCPRLDVGTNNFNNNTITSVNLNTFTYGVYNGGLVSTTTLVDYRNGPYQIFKVNSGTVSVPLQFTIAYFPNLTNLSKMTIQVSADDTLRQVRFAVDGATTILKNSSFPQTSTIPVTSSTHPLIIDVWTYDGGNTVFMHYHGQYS